MRLLLFILFPFFLSAQNADWIELQGKIDTAVKYGSTVRVDRNYRIDKPLIAYSWNGTQYEQVYFRMEGQGAMWDKGASSVITATFNDAPVFSIQKGKGCIIKGVTFRATSMGRDSRFSPQAAICIDPFSGLLPVDSGYPTLTEWYRGPQSRSGSTGIRFEDCTTNNTTIGVIISPNGYTQNGELLTFQNFRFGKHKYGFVGCQAQEKMNRLINVACWSECEVLFQFNKYGAGQPGNYIIDGVNIAGGVKKIIHRASGGWGPMHISNLFAEQIETIGEWDGTSGDSLDKAFINFKYKEQLGRLPDYHLLSEGLTVSNSNIRYYGDLNQPLLLSHIKSVNNCTYKNPIIDKYGSQNGKLFELYKGIYATSEVVNGTMKARNKYSIYDEKIHIGQTIVFMEEHNQKYCGIGIVTEKNGLDFTVSFISERIKDISNYIIASYI